MVYVGILIWIQVTTLEGRVVWAVAMGAKHGVRPFSSAGSAGSALPPSRPSTRSSAGSGSTTASTLVRRCAPICTLATRTTGADTTWCTDAMCS